MIATKLDPYNRMTAKRIKGEHCRFCGNKAVPLVKTRCCEQWICCDTKFLSFRGGGRCQYEHETYSYCHFHFNNGHKGKWDKCLECKNSGSAEDFEDQSSHRPQY